jgi:putative FmdB family regulatory protein
MPMFEFTCKKCGNRFEDLMTLAELEKETPACPKCESKKVERGFSAFATGSGTGSSGSAGGGCGPGGFT